MRWRRPALYPIVIPVALILQSWAVADIHPAQAIRPLVIATLVTLLLTVVLSYLCRNRDLGALAAAGIVLALVAASSPALAVVVLVAVGIVIALGVVRHGAPFPMGVQITRVMNLVAAVVLLATTISMVQSGAVGEGIADLTEGPGARSASAPDAAEAPDVYVILLDGYPGTDARSLLPEYPPSELAAGLRQRGFDMAADTHSNYLTTSVTLASMFQMQHLAHLPALAPPWGPDAADARRLRRLINDGRAAQAFRDAGYQTIGIASGFAEVEFRDADRLIEPIEPTEFEISLLRGTGVGNLLEAVTPDVMPALQRARIGDTLEAIRQVASEPAKQPRFVFAHVPAPHAPWVFGPDGSGRRESIFRYYVDSAELRGIDRKVALQRVLDQAAYLDGQVLDVIDGILADAPRPPVIVVFSDHGPGTGYQEADLADSDLVERSSNILAAYTPGHAGMFAQPTTPITIFPRLLDTYLGQDVPIPDDSIWAWGDSILDLHEIDVDDAP